MNHAELLNYQKVFANRFRTLLDARNMTPKDFAVDSGIPDATVYRYLHMDRTPKIDGIIQIAQYFGVSIDWMFGLSDSTENNLHDSVIETAALYNIASASDRKVVNAVLEKYKETKE